MNYESVENLSEEKILELYEDVIEGGENNFISTWYVCCENGNTGYWDNSAWSGFRYSNYIRYCGSDCTNRIYSLCGIGCISTITICGGRSEIGLEMTQDLEDEHKPNCFN